MKLNLHASPALLAPKPKPRTYDSLEEMLIELGLAKRQENPTRLGKAELHTSFSTSADPKLITWYENRSNKIIEVRHIYGDERDIPYEPGPNSNTLIIFHPHPFDEPCWTKYRCHLVEPEPITWEDVLEEAGQIEKDIDAISGVSPLSKGTLDEEISASSATPSRMHPP